MRFSANDELRNYARIWRGNSRKGRLSDGDKLPHRTLAALGFLGDLQSIRGKGFLEPAAVILAHFAFCRLHPHAVPRISTDNGRPTCPEFSSRGYGRDDVSMRGGNMDRLRQAA